MCDVPDKRVQNDACISSAEREEQVTKAQPKGNVPALRFPEFTEEWEKCKLGDITINFNLRNKDRINYPMYSVTNNKGFVPQSEQFEDREMIGEDIKAYKIIHKNDFAYNPARINVGSIAKYNGDNPCMISSLYVCFKACDRVDADWLMQLLKTSKMNFYYNVNGEGGVRIYLFYPNFARISTYLPVIAEQKKIAKFLSLLDERIVTQNKIIEDLKKLKSAIYQKIFESLVAPTLKLGQVVEIIKGQQINGTDLLEQGDYYVMNGGTTPSGWLNTYNTECNTISISEGGNSCGYVQYNTSRYWSGGHCYSLRILNTHETIDLYLYHYLKWQEGNIMALRIGSGLPNIQKKDLLRFPVILPTISLQKRIVSILNAIEEKVTCENSITEHFTKHKEYLLNKLFI